MVSLWYPATPSDGQRARYMTPGGVRTPADKQGGVAGRRSTLSTVRTNAAVDATPPGASAASPWSCSRPASPTLAARLPPWPRTWPATNTSSLRVITPTRATPRAFPDGRVPPAWPARHPAGQGGRRRAPWQAGPPMSAFVLNELTSAHPSWPGAGLIDRSRIGMARPLHRRRRRHRRHARRLAHPGWHSTWTAATTHRSPDHGLSRPFRPRQADRTPPREAAASGVRTRDGNLEAPSPPGAGLELLTGWNGGWWWRARCTLFTDLGAAGRSDRLDIGARLPGARSLDITRACVRALRPAPARRPQTLLDQPSPLTRGHILFISWTRASHRPWPVGGFAPAVAAPLTIRTQQPLHKQTSAWPTPSTPSTHRARSACSSLPIDLRPSPSPPRLTAPRRPSGFQSPAAQAWQARRRCLLQRAGL